MSTKKEVPACLPAARDSIESLLKLDESIVAGLSDGIQAAFTFAPEEWRSQCEIAIRQLAATGQVFTVDTLRRHGVKEPDRSVRWGAMFAAMKNRGLIESVGLQLHQAARGGISAIREWRGTAAGQGGE